ncbi:MAG TPA: helix-turn-helix domain-containing protein, partial [Burkholderiales bacterium]|nr:helix-turn-helix domain-containing protein [Burkholderiales bacterium]
LAQNFLDELNTKHSTHKTFPPAVLANLSAYHWPGNVRELKNYVQRAYILADQAIDAAVAVPIAMATRSTAGPTLTIPVGTSLEEADRQLILATLEQCDGVKKRAAEILGISLKTLYNRLEEFAAREQEKPRGQDSSSPEALPTSA